MLKEKPNPVQISLLSTFVEQLNHKHPLYILSNKIDWDKFEKELKKHYHETIGRPAKPIRLMVGLLILNHIRNLSDESAVEQCQENSYYQYFSARDGQVARRMFCKQTAL